MNLGRPPIGGYFADRRARASQIVPELLDVLRVRQDRAETHNGDLTAMRRCLRVVPLRVGCVLHVGFRRDRVLLGRRRHLLVKLGDREGRGV